MDKWGANGEKGAGRNMARESGEHPEPGSVWLVLVNQKYLFLVLQSYTVLKKSSLSYRNMTAVCGKSFPVERSSRWCPHHLQLTQKGHAYCDLSESPELCTPKRNVEYSWGRGLASTCCWCYSDFSLACVQFVRFSGLHNHANSLC